MDDVIDYISAPIPFISLTFMVYWGATWLYKRTNFCLFNPMVITIAVVIVILQITGIDYETYSEGGRLIEFWLQPAIVALALPLYNQMRNIKRQFISLFITELAGCIIGIISVVLIAKWLGASPEVICSLAPKSVSTPIAIEISRHMGGIPALTSAIVVIVGMLGAIFGLKVMQLTKISKPISQSLSMGTAAHVMGTNKLSEYGDRYGAYSTLGLILNGILTAIFAEPLVDILTILF